MLKEKVGFALRQLEWIRRLKTEFLAHVVTN